jgi:CRP-like cAMP-binding protein
VRPSLRVPGFEEIGYGGEPTPGDLVALRDNALFAGADLRALPRVLALVRVATLPAQTRLYVRGRSARRIFLIVAGGVAIVQNTGEVRTKIAALTPGEFTGERALLRPAVRHLWSAICTVRTRVGFLEADALLDATRAIPEIGVNVAGALHRRVLDASSAIDALIAGR